MLCIGLNEGASLEARLVQQVLAAAGSTRCCVYSGVPGRSATSAGCVLQLACLSDPMSLLGFFVQRKSQGNRFSYYLAFSFQRVVHVCFRRWRALLLAGYYQASLCLAQGLMAFGPT